MIGEGVAADIRKGEKPVAKDVIVEQGKRYDCLQCDEHYPTCESLPNEQGALTRSVIRNGHCFVLALTGLGGIRSPP